MKKKLFLTGIISVILIFGFIVIGCGEIQYANSFFNHGDWNEGTKGVDFNQDGTYEIINTKVVFTETTFTLSATYKDAPVTNFGFSGKYKVSGYEKADLYEIVGTSSTSGTAEIAFKVLSDVAGNYLILEIDGSLYYFLE